MSKGRLKPLGDGCERQNLLDSGRNLACNPCALPSKMTIDRRTFLVLTTRGSSVDAAGMPALLATPAAYIGVIGSRRRWATTVKELESTGLTAESLARVHSPMGLELHAETPEEIAVSILAEVLMVRDKGTGASMRTGRLKSAQSAGDMPLVRRFSWAHGNERQGHGILSAF